jgi:hypothetical protein
MSIVNSVLLREKKNVYKIEKKNAWTTLSSLPVLVVDLHFAALTTTFGGGAAKATLGTLRFLVVHRVIGYSVEKINFVNNLKLCLWPRQTHLVGVWKTSLLLIRVSSSKNGGDERSCKKGFRLRKS